jgi:hypothetical protein
VRVAAANLPPNDALLLLSDITRITAEESDGRAWARALESARMTSSPAAHVFI